MIWLLQFRTEIFVMSVTHRFGHSTISPRSHVYPFSVFLGKMAKIFLNKDEDLSLYHRIIKMYCKYVNFYFDYTNRFYTIPPRLPYYYF